MARVLLPSTVAGLTPLLLLLGATGRATPVEGPGAHGAGERGGADPTEQGAVEMGDCDDPFDRIWMESDTYVGDLTADNLAGFCDGYCEREVRGHVTITASAQSDLEDLRCVATAWSLTVRDNRWLVDLDGLRGLSSVAGPVAIQHNPVLQSLEGLSRLASVGGDLTISYNDQLVDLRGLERLSRIGGHLWIGYNISLADLAGLEGLTWLDGLTIRGNLVLRQVSGFGAGSIANVAGDVRIIGNPLLVDLVGFLGVTRARTLEINENPSLVSLDGLDALSWADTVLIEDNRALVDVAGLSGLTGAGRLTVRGNDALVDFDGLGALASVGEALTVTDNASLIDLSGLDSLAWVGDGAGGLVVSRNASLMDLSGLDALAGVSLLEIEDNPSLLDLTGLEGLVMASEVTIARNDALESLSSLSGLVTLEEGERGEGPGGASFFIQHNPSLASLDGLEQLWSVPGTLAIEGNRSLRSLAALSRLTEVGRLVVGGNRLGGLGGLGRLRRVETLEIAEDGLDDLSGLDALRELGDLEVRGADGLTSLRGLEGVEALGSLVVERNVSLLDLRGLDNVREVGLADGAGGGVSIQENTALTSLGGLESLRVVARDLVVRSNPSLSDVSALYGLVEVGGGGDAPGGGTWERGLVVTDNISLPAGDAQALADEVDRLGGPVTIRRNLP